MDIAIEGLWLNTILWEVPLMALICEAYFVIEDAEWDNDLNSYFNKTIKKGKRLSYAGCFFSDFGTRRRRSLDIQSIVVDALSYTEGFMGTSNMMLAKDNNIPVIGTMAHEWIMAHAGINGVINANFFALMNWADVFGDKLLLALTDTYTSDLFFKQFPSPDTFQGVRHDSGCPSEYTEKVLNFYKTVNIDPAEKKIIYSNGLDVDEAIRIHKYVDHRIQDFFGIGTHFTNDFIDSPALNIVIKMVEINNIEVAKISDDLGKESGSKEAIEHSLMEIKKRL